MNESGRARRRAAIALASVLLGSIAPAAAETSRKPPNPSPRRRPSGAGAPAAAKPARSARTPTAAGTAFGRSPAVLAFAAELAQRHAMPLDWLEGALAGARRLPAVQRLIMPPPAGTPKNWAAYRARFVEPQRMAAGVAFGRAHRRWLQAAEERFGVPAAIVLGIVGVETFYGRILGNFRVLDALATLSFDFPSGRSDRSAFFREELEHLLLWTHAQSQAPESVLGSYAGAIGLGQFMPGSIRRHAIDFDGDGRIEMSVGPGAPADTIGSIAQFLVNHGWQRGQATHYTVQPPTDAAALQRLLEPDILPSFGAAAMAEAGARLDEPGSRHDGPLALVMLENAGAEPTYVAGTANFYTLTRYNRSSYYALAVIELGQAVAATLD